MQKPLTVSLFLIFSRKPYVIKSKHVSRKNNGKRWQCHQKIHEPDAVERSPSYIDCQKSRIHSVGNKLDYLGNAAHCRKRGDVKPHRKRNKNCQKKIERVRQKPHPNRNHVVLFELSEVEGESVLRPDLPHSEVLQKQEENNRKCACNYTQYLISRHSRCQSQRHAEKSYCYLIEKKVNAFIRIPFHKLLHIYISFPKTAW